MNVRTRIAPSPTGDIHIGSISIALKNYAVAKKNNGQFLLRIEDTDKTREVAGGVQQIQLALKAFGLTWDEGPDVGGPHAPYLQSERLALYQQAAKQLVASGHAYYCFCSKERLEQVRAEQMQQKQPPKYDRHCRALSEDEVASRLAAGESAVIRLKVPDHQESHFIDAIRGEISFQTDMIDDQVLLKSDGFPTYHLAVVVDDHAMAVTHVLRGEEWISSTPKHILLYQAFGWDMPLFGHIPVYLNPNGKGKMSKRTGTVSAQSFLDQGYLPEALLNFLMILGWTPQDQREIMTLSEYVQEFDITDISKKSVVFDIKKLTWMNGLYIRSLTLDELAQRLTPFVPQSLSTSQVSLLLPLVRERMEKLTDFYPAISFFVEPIELSKGKLLGKVLSETAAAYLQVTSAVLSAATTWSDESIESALTETCANHSWNRKEFFMFLRRAVTGREVSPPLFETLAALGRDTTIDRLATATKTLELVDEAAVLTSSV